jgi:type I restriction enzyme S subunit
LKGSKYRRKANTEQLLGINIDKFFMPSVANVVGTDLSVYKVVSKNQFACNRMHVGRDYKLPISMSKTMKNLWFHLHMMYLKSNTESS